MQYGLVLFIQCLLQGVWKIITSIIIATEILYQYLLH